MNNTFMAKAETVERKWYLVDAAEMPLGRVASQVAAILRGKNKPIFTPHVDCGDHVVVVNCDKIILTGDKLNKKLYTYHTGYLRGLREIPYKKIMETKSDMALMQAVKGMLPKNVLGRQMLKRLRVYKGAEHNQQAQKPELIELVKRSNV